MPPPPRPATGANATSTSSTSKNSSDRFKQSNERNEYIPSFIAKKPFYIDDATASDADYLEHQRLQSENTTDTLANADWYARGSKKGPAATKYRKGACENCGSMSHTAKDCLQRKRKAGAKWTGRNIAADEVVKDVKLGWDAKRDRWNGFEAEEYAEVVQEFEAVEAMRKEAAGEAEDGEEGAKYEEETDMGRTQKNSTRNLRLREDTAKYLKNLDLDSARYDPKTRSMEAGAEGAALNDLVAEEGFEKASGDAAEFERAQTYAWETQERGDRDKIHMQANPTEALLTRKRKAEEEIQKAEAKRKALADKYGSQDTVDKKPALLAAAQTSERYVEYDERGRIKGEEKKAEKSMYAEDVLINNHTSVWGSWWKDFQWGYACCHSTMKNSFCTGEEGRQAAEEAERFSRGEGLPTAKEAGNAREVEREEAWEEEKREERHVPNGEDRPEKVNMDESKRRMEELKAGVTEADMEKYRREKVNQSDPMAKLLGKDELLDS
ncbi:unnamed protein product [Zymoseptoria tritici ST99CH_3D7]|uniref:Pre-mRNA-splicing factor SLU7 n=1 Tax=Zymoseptoria tritici (strain ST99CH_3D7) TaxID=1276538 RepID=A0A1X7S9D4_ZYMT9|nr:unnamed protein product [Zymoseptoria tritici ST99CH_3D7]